MLGARSAPEAWKWLKGTASRGLEPCVCSRKSGGSCAQDAVKGVCVVFRSLPGVEAGERSRPGQRRREQQQGMVGLRVSLSFPPLSSARLCPASAPSSSSALIPPSL